VEGGWVADQQLLWATNLYFLAPEESSFHVISYSAGDRSK
jgi:hypothetical protein